MTADSLFTVETAQVEVGKVYPIYGMITHIFTESTVSDFRVVVNYNILLKVNANSDETIQTLKSRIFEPGIFLTTITAVNDIDEDVDREMYFNHPESVSLFPYEGSCATVVYGKQSEFNA